MGGVSIALIMIAVIVIKVVEITARAKAQTDREGMHSNVIKHCSWDNSQDRGNNF